MKRKTIYKILGIICLIGLILSVAVLTGRLIKDKEYEQEAEKVKENIEEIRNSEDEGIESSEVIEAAEVTEDVGADSVDPAIETSAQPFPEMVQATGINSDIIGILEVGEDTCLYVVQGEDNDYYLTHNYNKESDQAGAAFLDVRCQIEPRDTNWMIHGHNMNNGAIFGKLDDFLDVDYVRNNCLVYLTLMYEKEVYVPYAIVDVNVDETADNYFKITEWNFETDEAFAAYTGYFQQHSYFNIPVDVQPDDELLTLSTCSYVYSDSRLLIACRKLRADESEDAMRTLMQSVEWK